MASPVITRPIFINGKWHPAVIVFNAPHLDNLHARLVGKNSMAGGGPVEHDVAHGRIVDPSLAQIAPLRGRSSALEALIDYLENVAGYKEHQQ